MVFFIRMTSLADVLRFLFAFRKSESTGQISGVFLFALPEKWVYCADSLPFFGSFFRKSGYTGQMSCDFFVLGKVGQHILEI